MKEINNIPDENEKLNALLNGYKNLFYTGENPVLVFDFSLSIVEVNLNAASFFNVNRNDLLGQKVYEFVSANDQNDTTGKKELVKMLMELKTRKFLTKKLLLNKKSNEAAEVNLIFKLLKFNGKDAVQMIFSK